MLMLRLVMDYSEINRCVKQSGQCTPLVESVVRKMDQATITLPWWILLWFMGISHWAQSPGPSQPSSLTGGRWYGPASWWVLIAHQIIFGAHRCATEVKPEWMVEKLWLCGALWKTMENFVRGWWNFWRHVIKMGWQSSWKSFRWAHPRPTQSSTQAYHCQIKVLDMILRKWPPGLK